MRRFNDKVVLVTGGASGLGRAIAQRLASEGATVVITDVQVELGRVTSADLNLYFIQHDVADEESWNAVVQETEARYGRLDVLVNNAGILAPMGASSPENSLLVEWKRIFSVNVEGVFLGCRAAIPAMRRAGGGVIINIASIAGLLATPYATAYGASKATVGQLTKSIAQHCAKERLNIRCNSVHPGDVMTPLVNKAMEERAQLRGVPAETIFAEAKAKIPMGEFCQPQDIAAAVAFLASEEARRITGADLIVDGGYLNCSTFR